MYIMEYDTTYCKNILWVVVQAYSEWEAVQKLHSLIDDVSNIRTILKQF